MEFAYSTEIQFNKQSSSKKRCHNDILCKHAELLDSLERELQFKEISFICDAENIEEKNNKNVKYKWKKWVDYKKHKAIMYKYSLPF